MNQKSWPELIGSGNPENGDYAAGVKEQTMTPTPMTTEREDEAGPKLLPCPFCGSKPGRLDSAHTDEQYVGCTNDDCFGPVTTAVGDDAIEQWNRRAQSPAPTGAGEAEKLVAWVSLADNGNVRFWTSDRDRAEREMAAGEELISFTLPELIAQIAQIPRWPQPTGDVGGPTPDDVGREKDRILRLFVPALGDKEDLLSYAKEVVALRSANSRLTEQKAEHIAAHRIGVDTIKFVEGKLSVAEARIAVLEKALEPFAELAGGFDAHIYNDEKWPLLFKDEDHPVDERGPTIGDLRRARAVLSTVAGEEKR